MALYYLRRSIRRLPGAVIHAVPIPVPEVTEGFGAREKIGSICQRAGVKSVLLVTDKTLYGLGYHVKIAASLGQAGIGCSLFYDIDSEPTVALICAGRQAALDCGADCIVALGGGSVLDSSKIIAASARRPMLPVGYYLQKFAVVTGKTLPMITVPSTAGTGAEHTVGAVVRHANGVKNSTVVVGLDVRHVVLDSELTVNAPQSVTVWCGIDALSHGLEGLLSDTEPNGEDLEKSRACVRLVMENLPVLLEDPQNIDARQSMSRAAFYGGNAINRELAGYIHAFAHSIGALYHIPHGKAIAYCTLPVLEAMRDVCRDKLAALSRFCGFAGEREDAAVAEEFFLMALKKLLQDCGLTGGCAALRREDYKRLTHMVNADSINYSPPKTFTNEEIHEILDAIGGGD